jgi:hypothetical protein
LVNRPQQYSAEVGQYHAVHNTALKRELLRVKKERDFLKEAAAYFAKAST